MRLYAALITLLAAVLSGCQDSAPNTSNAPTAESTLLPRPVADAAVPTAIRTTPNPSCLSDYLGTTGQLQSASDPGLPFATATTGGSPAEPAVAASLPRDVHFRDTQESFNATHYYAVRAGNIYLKANRELTGIDEPWRRLLLPGCLEGQVSEISVDGTVIIALDGERWLYTLDTNYYGPMTSSWTRRWGAFFWTDPGEQMPADVAQWATSHWSGADKRYVDRAGREHPIAGILTVYALRGDSLRITYMDPWLPSDESREVCGPERGTLAMAGLSGSGSTVMAITRSGKVYTRLYEFDVSGANSMFLDYSWQDQEAVATPLIQLPAPEWIEHAEIPGTVTNRISLRQLPPDTRHRIMRVEGRNASGHTGYWQKDLADTHWRFIRTDASLQGTSLPVPGAQRYAPEDSIYTGTIDGHRAEILDFNPYCSPATLRLHLTDQEQVDLVLHTTDGLRQERRARGLDAQPHIYRGAVEVPKTLWTSLDQQSAALRDFIERNFGTQRFLTGPVSATPSSLQITMPCWTLHREGEVADATVPASPPDLGIYVAEIRSAQEENRAPGFCPPAP